MLRVPSYEEANCRVWLTMASSQGAVSLFLAIEVVALAPTVFCSKLDHLEAALSQLKPRAPMQEVFAESWLGCGGGAMFPIRLAHVSAISHNCSRLQGHPRFRWTFCRQGSTLFFAKLQFGCSFVLCHGQVFRLEDELDVDRTIPQPGDWI